MGGDGEAREKSQVEVEVFFCVLKKAVNHGRDGLLSSPRCPKAGIGSFNHL